MCKLEQYRDALLEQEEYETRELIFVTDTTVSDEARYLTASLQGSHKMTRKEFDEKVERIKKFDKDFAYEIKETYNDWFDWAKVYRTDLDVDVRRSMSMNKENRKRQQENKYLKSSY